jgi:hypothetical protein
VDTDLDLTADIARWRADNPSLIATPQTVEALGMPGRCHCGDPVRLAIRPQVRWLNADGSRHACVTALRA